MDTTMQAPIAPPDASPPPFLNSAAGFPIAVIIAIGFVATALILVSYYFVVVKCWLSGGRSSSLLHRSRRDLGDRISTVFFTDYEAEGGGLDPEVISAIPVVKFAGRAGISGGKRKRIRSLHECAVCLCEFQLEEPLKMLPSCSHAFHIDCIDTWLHSNVSCPLCRRVITGPSPVLAHEHDTSQGASFSQELAGERFIDVARIGHGNSCRFPKDERSGIAHEPIRRSFSMDCFVSDRKPRHPGKEEVSQQKESDAEAGPSCAEAGSSNVRNGGGSGGGGGVGETSGRFWQLLSSFGLGRSSRSTVLPIQLDP